MPYVALAVMAAGALVGGMAANSAARKQNKGIAEAARANIANITKQQGQNRLSFYEATEAAAYQAQAAVGQARSAIGFDSGPSVTQYLASAVADAEAQQFIRQFNFRNREEALQTDKQVIATNARNGMVSPGTATLTGAVEGAQTALSLYSAASNLGQAQQQAAISEQELGLLQDQRQLTDLSIQGAQEQLRFQRDFNDWSYRQFGNSLMLRNSLSGSRFGGSTPFSNLFGNFGSNPIMPYATGGQR